LGHYDISVTANGFKVSTLTGVEVRVNSSTSLDITLQPGTVAETLTVVADAPKVESNTSEIGTVVSSREMSRSADTFMGTLRLFWGTSLQSLH
jgi:hypothetical protein